MGVAMQRRSTNTSSTTTVGGEDVGPGSKNGSTMESLRHRRRLRRKRSSGGMKIFEGMGIDASTQMILAGILLVGFAAAAFFKMSSSPVEHKSTEITKPHHGRRERIGSDNKRQNPYQDGYHRRGQRYEIPDAMEDYGDRSKHYAKLREEYDALLPPDLERSRKAVQSLHKRTYKTLTKGSTVPTYDIYNCPKNPPPNYPMQWNILDVLDNWNPDDTDPQTHIHQGLCVFDFEEDFEKALNYREAELPFIIKNDPEVLRTTERWNYPEYMERLMGDVEHRTEYSENNHFMYFVPPDRPGKRQRGKPHAEAPRGWRPPTKDMRMTYEEWLSHADTTDDNLGPDKPHWYHRLIGCGSMGEDCDRGSSEYLFDELTFFQPVEDKLYVVEPEEQKGIHCRFGMKGVIAENHFDATRNAIVLLGGERRYILSHPDQCENLALFPVGHPSARHSATDWTNPDLETFPEFADAMVNEVVMQAGDVMYLPTNWFHYIISLELNYQCNARSGVGGETYQSIEDCGF